MSLIECKGCKEQISKKAISCPKCGEPNKKKTSPAAMGCLTLIVIVFIIGLFSPSPTTTNSNPASNGRYETPVAASKPKPKVVKISNLSFNELDRIYSVSSNYTDLQKDEYWKKYKGKVVKWSGEVSSISKGMLGGLTLQIKMKPSTFTSDLIITLRKDQEKKALKISKGQIITFTGTLKSWGAILPISLDDGIIN